MTPQNRNVLSVLKDRRWHTTKELTDRTKIGYPPRRIHELRRKHGLRIESEKLDRKHGGWKRYRLLSTGQLSKVFKELQALKAPKAKTPKQSRLL